MSLKTNIFIGLFNTLICCYAGFADSLNQSMTLPVDSPMLANSAKQTIQRTEYKDSAVFHKYSPDAAEELIKNIKEQRLSAQDVTFVTACESGAQKASASCIEDFKDIQTQPFTAVGLAKEYIKKRFKTESVCSPKIRSQMKDDYIACVSTDTNGGKKFYEFRFDDVFETKDVVLSRDVRRGIGEIYHAEDAADEIKVINGTKVTKENNNICEGLLGATAHRFSLDSKYFDANNTPITAGTVYPHCKLVEMNFKPENWLTEKIIDTSIFKDLQTTLSLDLEVLLAQYTTRQLFKHAQIKLDKFWCNYNSHTYLPDKLQTDPDEYITCYVQIDNSYTNYTTLSGASYPLPKPWYYRNQNGLYQKTPNSNTVAKVYKIDFLFDDLSEIGKVSLDASKGALQCVSQTDGVYDGKHCTGLTEQQCTDLAATANIKTKWDDDTGCTLTANAALDVMKRAEKYTEIALGTTVIVFVTVATGGTPLYVAVAVGAGIAGGALAIASEALTDTERKYTDAFNQRMSQCQNAECVRKGMADFIEHISGYIDNLREEEIKAIDIILSDKLAQIEFTDQNDAELVEAFTDARTKGTGSIFDCFGHNNDGIQNTKCVFDSAALVLDFIPATKILAGEGKVGAKLLRDSKNVGKLAGKLRKLERFTGVLNGK